MTLAAQLGVAPVLLATFGPIPVASLPANLLCVPVAGLVMVWGLTAGLLAGVVGGAVRLAPPPADAARARVARARRRAHRPRSARRAPPRAGGGAGRRARRLVVLCGDRRGGRRARPLAVGAVLTAVVAAQRPCRCGRRCARGWSAGTAGGVDVVVLGGAAGGRASARHACSSRCAARACGTIDLLVVADPSVPTSVVELVSRAHRVGAVHDVRRTARRPSSSARSSVRIVAVPGRLVVDAVASRAMRSPRRAAVGSAPVESGALDGGVGGAVPHRRPRARTASTSATERS